MKKDVKKKLLEDINNNVTNFSNFDLCDQDRPMVLKVITNEIDLINSDEKHKQELKLAKLKAEAEAAKIKEQIELEKSKLTLENQKFVQQTKMDELKLELEMTKFKFEQEKVAKEEAARIAGNKKAKLDSALNTSLKILEIAAPLVVSFLLAKMDFRMRYIDDGMTPPTFKDIMKKVILRK